MQNLFLSSVGYFQFFFLRADDAVERPLFNVTHISWAILTDKYTIYCDSGTKLANSIHRVFNRNELVSIACDVHQYPVQDHPGHLRAVTIITFSHFYFPCIILIWLINWPFLLHTRKHICRISFENTFDYYYFIYFITHIIIFFSFPPFYLLLYPRRKFQTSESVYRQPPRRAHQTACQRAADFTFTPISTI